MGRHLTTLAGDSYRGISRHSFGPNIRRRAAAPGGKRHPAVHGQDRHAADARDRAEHSGGILRNGYCDRSRHGDRHGAAWRYRRAASQSRRAGAGGDRAGSQAVRKRHGGQSDHYSADRDAGRCAADHDGQQDQRHSRHRPQRQAGGHPDQSRCALCGKSQPTRQRADDDRQSRHRAAGHRAGRSASPAAPAPASRSCWWWTGTVAASA